MTSEAPDTCQLNSIGKHPYMSQDILRIGAYIAECQGFPYKYSKGKRNSHYLRPLYVDREIQCINNLSNIYVLNSYSEPVAELWQ